MPVSLITVPKRRRPIGNDTNKPGFSNVRSEVRARAVGMPQVAKADFSNVQSQVSSTVDEAADYTVVAGGHLTRIARTLTTR